jgi:hypothetical protein
MSVHRACGRVIAAVAIGSAVLLATPLAASAAGPGVVTRTACAQGTNAMLTLSHDDGHVEAEIELHGHEAGQPWTIRFYNEKVREVTVSQRSTAADGGGTLSVSRLMTNHAGTDSITVTAVNKITKERCVVRATL